ncbi:RDD family protein [Chryseobacterium sp. MDT2-18]|uniref:RDD family protein n=1 Tax=Chryseobacterium sp. MDT2-18 TaxID=1259136 RepID=UPI002784C82A|nr:RDD family protein [Chryseobacterium sp. MDT2-18]MDQ0477965.1 hypothetical protein [Chryseobacterium sp. MDT2-18]
MKISELKQNKTIHRPTQNFDEFGHRIYQEFDYDFDFATHSNEIYSIRFFAKIIDIIPAFLIVRFLLHQNIFLSFIYSIPIIIILNSILEWKTGQTLGKKIFKLKVVDDYARYPEFIKSLKRNFLCLINLFPSFYDIQDRAGVWATGMHFNMQLNNKFCQTYVIKENIYFKIKDLLDKKTPHNN